MYVLESSFVVAAPPAGKNGQSAAPLLSVQLEPCKIRRDSLGPVLTPPGVNCPLTHIPHVQELLPSKERLRGFTANCKRSSN